jgi:tetratricopeptide (TPR) repeat protein
LDRARAKFGLNQKDAALEELAKAIQLSPDYYYSYWIRGNIYLLSNSNQNATDDYTKVIQWQPNNAEAYLNRGFAKEKSNDLQGAQQDFQTAINLFSSEGNTHEVQRIQAFMQQILIK